MILKCKICGAEFLEDEAPRREDGSIRLDARGYPWCKACTEQFDLIEHNKDA